MLNKCTFIGRLGKDPELKTSEKTGKSFANIGIATSSGYGDNKKTLWVDVVAFDKKAEIMCQYLRKGDPVYVEGELEMSEWTDKNDNKRTSPKLVLQNVVFIHPKSNGATTEADEPVLVGAGVGTTNTITSEDIPF